MIINTFRHFPYDALTLLENILHPSHVAFIYDRTVRNRAKATSLQLEVINSGKHAFKGVWKQGFKPEKIGELSTTLIAPILIWHDINSQG